MKIPELKFIRYKKHNIFMDTLLEIRSAVICNHQRSMMPKEIVLMVKISRWTVVALIKKWKDTGSITPKKFINDPYPSSKSQKDTRDLTSKESSNEIRQYFDINIHPASVRRILIKFDNQLYLQFRENCLTVVGNGIDDPSSNP